MGQDTFGYYLITHTLGRDTIFLVSDVFHPQICVWKAYGPCIEICHATVDFHIFLTIEYVLIDSLKQLYYVDAIVLLKSTDRLLRYIYSHQNQA